MRKKKGRVISPEYALDKLLEWNPQWCRHTIEAYPVKQLIAIYYSERTKIVKQIYADLGLQY